MMISFFFAYSNDLIDPAAAFSTSRCKDLNVDIIPIHLTSTNSIKLFLMFYQPYAIFFKVDYRLYIKFEALYWGMVLPKCRLLHL